MTLGWGTVESVDIVEKHKFGGLGRGMAAPKAYKVSSRASPVTHHPGGIIVFSEDT